MSIRTKILFACISLTAITLAFGLVTLQAEFRLGQIATRLYDEAFMSMSYLRSAQNSLLVVSREIAEGTGAPDAIRARLDDAVGDIGVAVDRALSPKGHEAAVRLMGQLTAVATSYGRERALPSRSALNALERNFDHAVELNAGDGFRARRSAEQLISGIRIQNWITMACSVGLALLITLVLSRAIVPALQRAVRIASCIAEGRLDNEIAVRGSSETATLLSALKVMQASIADKITQIESLLARQATHHASEMASQHVKFETALDNMAQGLCMFDDSGRVLVHNRRFAELFGPCSPGTHHRHAVPEVLQWEPDSDDAWVADRTFTASLEDERTISVVEKPMRDGGWVATYEDVTERHRFEARLAHVSRHDPLTGLPNRLHVREHLEKALARARRKGGVTVLCLNLDRFKTVNEGFGLPVGDQLLCAVADRLRHSVRETDVVTRLSADEFAIIQESDSPVRSGKILAERLLETLRTPFALADHCISISASLGAAVSDDGRIEADKLLKSAEVALSRAKKEDIGGMRFFEADMDAQLQARRRTETDLRTAIAGRQFVNYYQPLVNTRTGAVIGAEALARWPHPVRGMVPPAEFIPIAEELGLIGELGLLVLESACTDAMAWPDDISVAVNLSPFQFRSGSLVRDIRAILDRTGLPPSRLELEITESLMLQDSRSIQAILHELRVTGVRFSLDDFGTGYSSLAYLHRFPFNKIKIDQSFVRDLTPQSDRLAIIRAVLSIGKSLGMRVIVEGVETREQLDLLRSEGCEEAQGYLFSKPRPVSEITAMLGEPQAWAERSLLEPT